MISSKFGEKGLLTRRNVFDGIGASAGIKRSRPVTRRGGDGRVKDETKVGVGEDCVQNERPLLKRVDPNELISLQFSGARVLPKLTFSLFMKSQAARSPSAFDPDVSRQTAVG